MLTVLQDVFGLKYSMRFRILNTLLFSHKPLQEPIWNWFLQGAAQIQFPRLRYRWICHGGTAISKFYGKGKKKKERENVSGTQMHDKILKWTYLRPGFHIWFTVSKYLSLQVGFYILTMGRTHPILWSLYLT